ncbi:LysR family transcription regulator [Kutzneria albida DSM 43870]|uniref:LysR family transcription regulator n=1 Tax=Kutzneria albida DSM 43870 TaxID=1449976 RepID=W5W4D7_9PSEU|nr:LysR family transcription regulator [Kutzneria albida DSM 43870]
MFVSHGNLLDGNLKLRHLRYTAAIAEHGSLIAAADHLKITQPVLTRCLRELESILGVELFERGPRGMTPTVFGHAFVDHARAVLAELRHTDQHMRELAAGQTGQVTIGTHLAGANVLLPRAVARLKEAHPDITVVVRHGTLDGLRQDLLTGELDLVVGTLEMADSSRMTQVPLYQEPLRLVARVAHPAHSMSKLRIPDLADHLWSVPMVGTPLRREVQQLLLRHGLPLPRNRIEVNSYLAVRSLALETDVLVLLPQLVAEAERDLVPLPLDLGIAETVGLTLPAESPLTPALRQMLEYLRQAAVDIRSGLEAAQTYGQK